MEYDSEEYKKASNEIAEQLKIADEAVAKAMAISDVSGVEFSLDIGGYGMGGWYDPENKQEYTESHWHPSSMSC